MERLKNDYILLYMKFYFCFQSVNAAQFGNK